MFSNSFLSLFLRDCYPTYISEFWITAADYWVTFWLCLIIQEMAL